MTFDDYTRVCKQYGIETEDINIWGVCPDCHISLMEEARIQNQEDIDDYWAIVREGISS